MTNCAKIHVLIAELTARETLDELILYWANPAVAASCKSFLVFFVNRGYKRSS